MNLPNSMSALAQPWEVVLLAIAIGFAILILFRFWCRSGEAAQWVVIDLVFVSSFFLFVRLFPTASTSQLCSFAVIAAVVLGNASLVLPSSLRRQPEIDISEPEPSKRAKHEVRELKKAA